MTCCRAWRAVCAFYLLHVGTFSRCEEKEPDAHWQLPCLAPLWLVAVLSSLAARRCHNPALRTQSGRAVRIRLIFLQAESVNFSVLLNKKKKNHAHVSPLPLFFRRSGAPCQGFRLCMRDRVSSQGGSRICKPSAFRPKRASPKKKHAIGHKVSVIIASCLVCLFIWHPLTHTHKHNFTHALQTWSSFI